MTLNFKEFFNSTPRVIDFAIGFSLLFLAGGTGVAIGFSRKVNVGHDWLQIERQAIANQNDLEQALTIIKIQDGIIERHEAEAREFTRQHEVGEPLLEQAEFAAEVIPDSQISELEDRLGESKLLLEEALPH